VLYLKHKRDAANQKEEIKMTVKELYMVCNNLYDNTPVKMLNASGEIDLMYMRDFIKRYESYEVEWFDLLQNGMCTIEVRL
jgi:hypothetical protein